jgi:Ankyrin repeats (3 copies)
MATTATMQQFNDRSCEELRMEVYLKQHQLIQACSQRRPDAVLDLLRCGASAAWSDSSWSTPLHFACRSGSPQTVKAVLEAPGCDIDAVDSQGHNAVYWACDAANAELLQLLRPAAQLSTAARVNQVIKSVEWWQQAACSDAKPAVLTFLYGLSKELAAAEAQPLAAAGQQQQEVAVKAPAKACCICLEDFVGTSISCSTGSHCMCMPCLEGYVAAETSSSKQRIAANKGKLCCPGDGCSNVFEHHLLARHLPPDIFGKLLAAWQACIEQAAMQTGAEQAKQELAREAAKDDVGKAKAHVLDSILMLKCPRCHKAFDAFDGCFAVRCRDTQGNGCGAAFCGYCLKDCGRDAHKHVGECVHNSNGGRVFASEEHFKAAQCSRRRRMVLEYLETLPLRLRERVKPAIAPDLKDLGIDLNNKPQQQQLPKKQQALVPRAAAVPVQQQQQPALPRAAAAPVQQQQQQQQALVPRAAAAPVQQQQGAAPAPYNNVFNRVFVNGVEVQQLRYGVFQGPEVFNFGGGVGSGAAVAAVAGAAGDIAAHAGAVAQRAGAVAAREGAAVAAAAAAQRQAAQAQRAQQLQAAAAQRQAAAQQRAAAEQQRAAAAQQRQAAAEQRAAAEQQRAAAVAQLEVAAQQRAEAAQQRQAAEQQCAVAEQQRAVVAQQQGAAALQGYHFVERAQFGPNMVMHNCHVRHGGVWVNGQLADMARYMAGAQLGTAAVAQPAQVPAEAAAAAREAERVAAQAAAAQAAAVAAAQAQKEARAAAVAAEAERIAAVERARFDAAVAAQHAAQAEAARVRAAAQGGAPAVRVAAEQAAADARAAAAAALAQWQQAVGQTDAAGVRVLNAGVAL